MSGPWTDSVLEILRRDGSVVVAATDIGDVDAWRRDVRQACRAAGLHVRTGVNDHGAVWAYHADHVGTDAELHAAGQALSNLLSGKPSVPFHELVREEQRKRLAVVDGAASAAPDTSEQPDIVSLSPRPDLSGDIDGLVITYSSRQAAFKIDEERRLHQWYAKIQCVDDNGVPAHEVGYVVAYTVAFHEVADPFGLLDAETADLGHIASILFDVSTGELNPDLADQLEPFGDGVLIIGSVRLQPVWRGHGLGPLLVGMVIEYLGEGRQFVALQAAPTERRSAAGDIVDKISKAERRAAVTKLGALWSQLGFEFFKDEVWVLDLGLTVFGERMEAIRAGVGIA